jgi:hypothetical protein
MRYRLQNNTEIDLSLSDRYNIAIGYLKDYITNMVEMETMENDTLKAVAKNRITDAVEEYIDYIFDEIENDKDFVISLMFDDDPYNSSGSAPVDTVEVSAFSDLLKECNQAEDGFDFSMFFSKLPSIARRVPANDIRIS